MLDAGPMPAGFFRFPHDFPISSGRLVFLTPQNVLTPLEAVCHDRLESE
jgi:hypothetical protein